LEHSKKRKQSVSEDGEKEAAVKELMGPKRKIKLLAHNADLERAQNVTIPTASGEPTPVKESKKRKKEDSEPHEKAKKRVSVVEPANVVEVVYDESAPHDSVEEEQEISQEMPVTDLDWLRARTSRTLGLVSDSDDSDNEDSKEFDDDTSMASEDDVPQPTKQEATPTPPPAADPLDTEEPASSLSIAESKILKTGRLFIRNLVYGVTEDDLRNIFSSYGQIEEVSVPPSYIYNENMMIK
jgi:multiple RNA-binding domain-containing protein 1